MSSLIHSTAHGFVADDQVYFGNVVPDTTGIVEGTPYFVLAAGLTADDFAFSETLEGAAFALAFDIESGNVSSIASTYSPIMNPADVMSPPVPPITPILSQVTSTVTSDATGAPIGQLIISIEDTHIPSLRVTYIEVTGMLLPDGVTPDFSSAIRLPIASGQTTVTVPGISAGADYWVRTFAEDVFGNQTDYAAYVAVTSVKDSAAPNVPTGLNLVSSVRAIFATWNIGVAPAQDLAFNEIRYSKDDGTGLASNGVYTTLRTKTNAVYIGGLVADSVPTDGVADQLYWVQVRAVDTTGNVGMSALDYIANPEEGWCTAVSAIPSLVDGDLVAFNSLNTNHISSLDASVIKTGNLLISAGNPLQMDGIKVYDGDVLVGLWDETGLYVYSASDSSDYVQVFNGGITVYLNGIAVSALTTGGVNADAITFGTVPGGGNVVMNSSFELADFSVPTTVTFDDTASADFTASRVGADINVTTGATALTETGVTY